MITIINKLLSFTWLGDIATKINGSKTVIGIISLIIWTLHVIPSVFPELGITAEIAARAQEALLWIGVTLTPIGAIHKVTKALDEKSK